MLNQDSRILVKYLDPRVAEQCPFRPAREGDAGFDLCYAGDAELVINPHQRMLVPSGVAVKIPRGWVGIVCGRSSTFGKRGLFVVEGRIDSGYTGQLHTTVWHPAVFGDDVNGNRLPVEPVVIQPWDRLAQIVVVPHHAAGVFVLDGDEDLPRTERGSFGYGSTGR